MTNSNPLPNTPDSSNEVVKASAGGLEELKKLFEEVYRNIEWQESYSVKDYDVAPFSFAKIKDFMYQSYVLGTKKYVEQCFCKSYSNDSHEIVDCTCGKCK